MGYQRVLVLELMPFAFTCRRCWWIDSCFGNQPQLYFEARCSQFCVRVRLSSYCPVFRWVGECFDKRWIRRCSRYRSR